MPIRALNTAVFNPVTAAGGLQAAGPDANLGIRHGTMSGPTGQANYEAASDVLHLGWRPRAYTDYLDFNGGDFLPNSQAAAYTLGSSNRNWVREYADDLPGDDRLKMAVNMGGVTDNGSPTIAAVMATDPLVVNSSRWLLLDSLDELVELAANHKVTPIISPCHEFQGNWYNWGWEKATHAEFISFWQWLATEAHARGLLVAWTLSIGPLLSGGLETGSDPNVQRWPGSQYVDICVLNHYDKAESNRNPATLLSTLQEFRAFAIAEGCAVGLGEWGSGGHHGIEHLSNTHKEIDTWPAGLVPGGLYYEIRWNPSNGGPAEGGQSGVTSDEYYDITRTPGVTEFPGRAAYESDLHTWVVTGKNGQAPYDNIQPYLDLEAA